ncbi:hypothetical protein ACTXT7_011851 [Hymenolepis weldensis]
MGAQSNSALTEEQTKLGLSVDASGNPIIQPENPKKSKESPRSRPSKMAKTTRKKGKAFVESVA